MQYLDYEAYEGMAEGLMAEIAAELAERYELCGDRDPPPHRPRADRRDVGRDRRLRRRTAQDALAACKDAIDELKERVPLWKKEVYEGGEEWIGQGS